MTTKRYAAKTEVAPERSRAEIERTLARYGADAFSYGYDPHQVVVMFAAHGRRIRFDLLMPELTDFKWTRGGREWASGARRRTETQQRAAHEQAIKQLWRALALVIKAKLEAVEAGIVTFEQEFLAHILLPDGSTVGDWATPQLEEVYATGEMPAVLPGGRPALTVGGGDG